MVGEAFARGSFCSNKIDISIQVHFEIKSFRSILSRSNELISYLCDSFIYLFIF